MDINRNGLADYDERIAAEVRAQMARENTSQKTLAEMVGKHPNIIGRKVRGEVPFSSAELSKVARALHTTAAQLITDAERRMSTKEAVA